MTILTSIILGVVQGIAEFLPISSSGHLILTRTFLSMTDDSVVAFDAVLHIATTLVVILYFRKELWVLFQTLLRLINKKPVDLKNTLLLKCLFFATLPAATAGFFLDDLISGYLQSFTVMAISWAVMGLFFMAAEWYYTTRPQKKVLTFKRAMIIGSFQMLALLPGLSRSGSTIGSGMLLGLTRYDAARFSFLLSIPISLGAGLKKLLNLLVSPDEVRWLPILVGSAVAFIFGMIAINLFMNYIRRHTLWPFVWYSFVLAGLVAYLSHIGAI